jgi:hypothetical protein
VYVYVCVCVHVYVHVFVCVYARADAAVLTRAVFARARTQPWPRALLPAVYPIWPPLLQLIGGADRALAAHGMRALALGARVLGDELSSRVMADAISEIVQAVTRLTSARGADRAALASVVRAPSAAAAEAAAVLGGGVPGGGALGGGGSPGGGALGSGAPSVGASGSKADADAADALGGLWRDSALPRADEASSGEGRWANGRGRSEEELLAACDCLAALCVVHRAMRGQIERVLSAVEPLLTRHQPERVQRAALALCRRLAALEPDLVWLRFVRWVPPPERWPKTPPAGCGRLSLSTLLEPAAALATAAHTHADGAAVPPAHARCVLEAVRAADLRAAAWLRRR